MLVSCPGPYFSGIGSGSIVHIELFQRKSITVYICHNTKHHLKFHNRMKNVNR